MSISDEELEAAGRQNTGAEIEHGFHPLNPVLYSVLRRQYGQVLVANEGEAFVGRPTVDSASGRKAYEVVSSGEYYRVCCPFCRDTKFRLWINHTYGVFDSWIGGSQRHMVFCFNDDDCMGHPANRQQLHMRLSGLIRAVKAPVVLRRGNRSDARLKPSDPPGSLIRLDELPQQHPAVLYLRDRGFDPVKLGRDLDVAYCTRAEQHYLLAEDRIISPMRQNNMLVGWQGRYVGDLDWKVAGIPKYYTKPGMNKRMVLYNHDVARQHPVVVLVEGVTDAWAVGPCAVASLGCGLHHYQKRLLCNSWSHGMLVLMYDEDAFREIEGLLPEMSGKFEYGVVPVRLPENTDPGQFSRAVNWNFICAAVAQNNCTFPPGFNPCVFAD